MYLLGNSDTARACSALAVAFRARRANLEWMGRISEAQIAVMRHLVQAGHGCLCSGNYREVIEILKALGVVRSAGFSRHRHGLAKP